MGSQELNVGLGRKEGGSGSQRYKAVEGQSSVISQKPKTTCSLQVRRGQSTKQASHKGGGDSEAGRRDRHRSPHSLLTLEGAKLYIWVKGRPKPGHPGQAGGVRSSSVGFPSVLGEGEQQGHNGQPMHLDAGHANELRHKPESTSTSSELL